MNLYIVVGTNGLGNSGDRILGVYPSLKQAKARIKAVLADEDEGFRDVFYDVVKQYDAETGGDCRMALD